jgi:tRNA (guanine-N7-)-methyltransferase
LNPPLGSDGPPPAKADAERIQFYGRRKGKALKAGRISLLETLLPDLRISVPGAVEAIDPASFFDKKYDELRLEIGFGSGEHIAAQAAANPNIGFIGCEVFINGIASLLRYVDEGRLTNLRIYDNDIRHLIPRLAGGRLARVSLPFPDPWPKARHAKRRFVSPTTLDEMARLLASDHPVYQAWTLLHATVHPSFQWTAAEPEDWRVRPADSVATRYEEKARAAGRIPFFLNFSRKPRNG